MKISGEITNRSEGLASFSLPALDVQGWCEDGHDTAQAAASWVEASIFACLGIRVTIRGHLDASGNIALETEQTKELLGFMLQQQRRRAGLSVREVAARAGIKSAANVTHYEMGRSEPSFSKMQQLLGAMGYELSINLQAAVPAAAMRRVS